MNKKILFSIALIFAGVLSAFAQKIINPSTKTATTFAIVVDKLSYDQVQEELHAYRKVVEADGLGTYIIISDGMTPDQIREVLQKLYRKKHAPLEGCVFVGEIPIPMIRDAQHMTSAFKMDQDKYAWDRSSVPSDRFYDDFDLTFDFIKQDDKEPSYYYYSLRHDSHQALSSDIYSARMRPYDRPTQNKYEALRNYLKKVVKERTNNPDNELNQLSMGRGHGYNAESKDSWANEQLALREQLPYVFSHKGKIKVMDYDDVWPIKDYYLTEVQREDLDVMLFHHHGGVNAQYLNGYREGSSMQISKENIALFARQKARDMKDKSNSESECIQQTAEKYDIPTSWIDNCFEPEVIKSDSLLNRSLDIYIDDIRGIKPAARFIMFDACFNGSFHKKDNVASEYIFNEGSTLVVQANTVNVIQDKWPDEALGLLSYGLRIGFWHNQVNFLETHLIGDPTYRFQNSAGADYDINHLIRLRDKNYPTLLKLLSEESGDIQALTLSLLYERNFPGISDRLLNIYTSSSSFIVRMQCLTLLSQIDDHNFIEVLKLAPFDSYELIRRFAIELIGKNGSDELIPVLAKSLLWDTTSSRTSYKQTFAISMMNSELLKSELEKQLEQTSIFKDDFTNRLFTKIDRAAQSFEKDLEILTSTDNSKKAIKEKKFLVRSVRNNPDKRLIPALIDLVNNPSSDSELRVIALEALGWYNNSSQKSDILLGIEPLHKDEDKSVREEAIKTSNRLK